MKKYFYISLTVVAALSVSSCSKSEIPDGMTFGVPACIDLESVTIGDVGEAESKVVFNGINSNKYTYKWEPNDAIKIFSFDWEADKLLEWGRFVTENGGTWGRFYGYIPKGFNPDDYTTSVAICYPRSSNFTLKRTSTSGKYELKFNIPSEQDGSGIPYCIFAPQGNMNATHFTVTRTVDSSDPDDQSKWTYSFSGKQFRCCNALSRVVVPESANVKTIKVTVKHSLRDIYALCSTGDDEDISMNCSPNQNWGSLSGGTSKTITIHNGGQTLGEVFFASRQTNAGATNGYASLIFEFINDEGKVATKTVILAQDYTPGKHA